MTTVSKSVNQNVRRIEIMSVSQNRIKMGMTLDLACVAEGLRARVRQGLTLST